MDVIVVEPGPIRTSFGDTAIQSIGGRGGAADAYADFNLMVATKIREAYEGPMGRLAAGPDAVAQAIERAVTARRPATRYTVTAAARVLMGLRRWLPDRAFDAMLRTQFPAPRP